MAQSPEKNAPTTEILRYDLGWKSINAMLRSGRSLSGHERNCCFLNTHAGRFADVSGVTALDYADDGRVLALADWDYDGDIDFWIANRSGPQLRYLENRLNSSGNFLAVRLTGVHCNRDGIGARVRVSSQTHGQRMVQTRTLKAGEGYLGQNSKWLHFGIGDATGIEQLAIQWPNGTTQIAKGLAGNRWYAIEEGRAPTEWTPPRFNELREQVFTAPSVSDRARIVLLQPIPMPAVSAADSNGLRVLSEPGDRARLITLWATWCQPCLKELNAWKQHASEFDETGVEVIAVNVDEEAPDRKDRVERAQRSLGLPFSMLAGSAHLVEQFDVLQRSLLSRQRPLPLPSSFLIDRNGRLRVIYKGPVDAETLLDDVSLTTADQADVLAASLPFKGKWFSPPGGSTPLSLALKYMEGGLVDEAISYIESLAYQRGDRASLLSAGLTNLLGAAHLDKQQFGLARKAFERSLELEPTNRQAHIELGTILLRSSRGRDAIPHFKFVLGARPNDPELLYKLALSHMQAGDLQQAKETLEQSIDLQLNAQALWQLGHVSVGLGDASSAIAAYEQAISINPSLVFEANNLAWLLATSSRDELRNGARAEEIARQICDHTGGDDIQALDTWAAALAETGGFQAAIDIARQASELASNAGQQALAKRINARIQLYRRGLPFRESLR